MSQVGAASSLGRGEFCKGGSLSESLSRAREVLSSGILFAGSPSPWGRSGRSDARLRRVAHPAQGRRPSWVSGAGSGGGRGCWNSLQKWETWAAGEG